MDVPLEIFQPRTDSGAKDEYLQTPSAARLHRDGVPSPSSGSRILSSPVRRSRRGCRGVLPSLRQSAEATLGEMFIYMPATFILTLKLSCASVAGLMGRPFSRRCLPRGGADSSRSCFCRAGFFIPDIVIRSAYKARLNKFRIQMIDGLHGPVELGEGEPVVRGRHQDDD